jgi:hypothetical protein
MEKITKSDLAGVSMQKISCVRQTDAKVPCSDQRVVYTTNRNYGTVGVKRLASTGAPDNRTASSTKDMRSLWFVCCHSRMSGQRVFSDWTYFRHPCVTLIQKRMYVQRIHPSIELRHRHIPSTVLTLLVCIYTFLCCLNSSSYKASASRPLTSGNSNVNTVDRSLVSTSY